MFRRSYGYERGFAASLWQPRVVTSTRTFAEPQIYKQCRA